MINEVEITRRARKDLLKVPVYVAVKLKSWVDLVERKGVREARKIPGYHDEGLRGKRKGQRSIRLSKAYRAIYRIKAQGEIEFISIEEVNKHEY